jgi:hypothetical protein
MSNRSRDDCFAGCVCVWATAAGLVLALFAREAAAQPLLKGTLREINVGAGDQLDPHVDCDLASYTSVEGLQSDVRVFDFRTGSDVRILRPGVSFLSDISGTRVTFTETSGDGSNIIVYDTDVGYSIRIPGSNQRTNPSIGGALVAFEAGIFSTNQVEIVLYDLSTATLTGLTNDALMDSDPQVSPSGDVVVWIKCQTSSVGCDLYSSGPDWSGQLDDEPAYRDRRRGIKRGYERGDRCLHLHPPWRSGHLLPPRRRWDGNKACDARRPAEPEHRWQPDYVRIENRHRRLRPLRL